MNEVLRYAIVCVTIILISGATISACDRSNKRAAAIKLACIENGGTWVANTSSGACVVPRPSNDVG